MITVNISLVVRQDLNLMLGVTYLLFMDRLLVNRLRLYRDFWFVALRYVKLGGVSCALHRFGQLHGNVLVKKVDCVIISAQLVDV